MSLFDNFTGPLNTTVKATHARPVTYTPDGGSPVAITGMFVQDSDVVLDDSQGSPVRVKFTSISVLTSDVPAASQADTFTVDAQVYSVTSIAPDDGGMTMMTLTKVTF